MNLFYIHSTLYFLFISLRSLIRYIIRLKNYCCPKKSLDVPPLIGDSQSNAVVLALDNSEIFDNILQHLPTSEILQCSLVCELWRKRCRRFLRDKKHCKIILKSEICFSLIRLNKLLENSTDLPFIGLYLQPSGFLCLQHTPLLLVEPGRRFSIGLLRNLWAKLRRRPGIKEDIMNWYPYLFQKLPVQYLYIDYPTQLRCNGDNYIKNLIRTRVSTCTEYLEIINWPEDVPSFSEYLKDPDKSEELAQPYQPTYLLKSLKTFNFNCPSLPDRVSSNLIRDIVESSPALKCIYGDIPAGMLMSDSSFTGPYALSQMCVTKRDRIRTPCIGFDLEVFNLARVQSRMEILGLKPTISVPSVPINNFQLRVVQSLRNIIEANKHSLLKINLYDTSHSLSLVMNKNIGPLIELRQLVLQISPAYGNFDDIRLSLKKINFQTSLPNLSSVELIIKEGAWVKDKFVRDFQIHTYLTESTSFRCLSVTNLKISCEDEASKTFYKLQGIQIWHDLADVFPSVKSLDVPDNAETVDFWEQLSVPWRNSLESVTCTFDDMASGFGDVWIFVIQLMEKFCCDINLEEMNLVDLREIPEYSYAATRNPFCYETRISHIKIKLEHKILSLCMLSVLRTRTDEENWNERFELLCSWIAVKLPNFCMQIEYKPCLSTICNPLRLPVGIRSVVKPFNSKEEIHTVMLKNWSDIERRRKFYKRVENCRKFLYLKLTPLIAWMIRVLGPVQIRFRCFVILVLKLFAIFKLVDMGCDFIDSCLPSSIALCQQSFSWLIYLTCKLPYFDALLYELLLNERVVLRGQYISVIVCIGVSLFIFWLISYPFVWLITFILNLLLEGAVHGIWNPMLYLVRMLYDQCICYGNLMFLVQNLE